MTENREYVKAIAEELEAKGAFAFFDAEDGTDIYDIEYSVDSQLDFRGARVAIAIGGPNVYLDSRKGAVELFWGTDEEYWYLTESCRNDMDAYFEELYNLMRDC